MFRREDGGENGGGLEGEEDRVVASVDVSSMVLHNLVVLSMVRCHAVGAFLHRVVCGRVFVVLVVDADDDDDVDEKPSDGTERDNDTNTAKKDRAGVHRGLMVWSMIWVCVLVCGLCVNNVRAMTTRTKR